MAKTNEPTAPQRAYQDIKAKLLNGRFRLRQRLDPGAIAADLGLSTTPVREALLRLWGERLVNFRPSLGFSVTMWSEAGLRDLYRWRGELAELALTTSVLPLATNANDADDYATRIGSLLAGLQSGVHTELLLAGANADDRLFVARVAEAELWPDVDRDYQTLREASLEASPAALGQALKEYHAKRVASAKEIRETAALLHFPTNGA